MSLVAQADELKANSFHQFRFRFNSLFLQEDFSAAKVLCLEADRYPEIIPAEKLELSRCFMIIGAVSEALACLDEVLRLEPKNQEALLSKSRILRTLDNSEAYLALLQHCLSLFPGEQRFYELLYQYYQDQGDNEAMEKLISDAELNSWTLNLAPLKSSSTSIDDQYQGPEYNDPQLLENYLSLFSGRENYHARQWVSDKGKAGYTPVPEPLNTSHIRSHLMGLYTLGVYQLNLQSQVKWIVFDLDVCSDYLAEMQDSQFKQWIDEGFTAVLQKIDNLLSAYHLDARYEFSGNKGYHIWLFFADYISAALARGFAQKLASQFELGAYPFSLEIFPKQTRISANNFGNLLKLPGGIHRLSGLRSYFVKLSENKPEAMPLKDLLLNPPLITADIFVNAVYSLQPDFTAGVFHPTLRDENSPSNFSASEIPSSDPLEDPQWLHLKSNCRVIAHLNEHLETDRFLTPNQKKVITYTAGLLNNGAAIVNALLAKCSNANAADLLKSPLKGNPVSCAKIRSHLGSEIEEGMCQCDFTAFNSSYDTPLLHLSSLANTAGKGPRDHELVLRDTIARYLDIRKKHNDYEKQLQGLEKNIFDLFAEIGVSQFQTGFGLLKKVEENSQTRIILEF